ncbi:MULTISPECIES: hypothetical protein [Streptomyces]|uniref:hypothetical protein n=1 Tax=Streptomyces TaxID=1883 RepID=UPI00226DFB35|nr:MULTISPECIES: hypothetical protein [unclassified Streptomyces]MCY0923703.1 hypothetical protein [Streptomyces sp. H27-G5]MCY0947742.1 hypothetical protein [Streptomyces sp. H34-AA3]MDJ0466985.1 hypothetical protein [Streptomyces sp. H27-C3]
MGSVKDAMFKALAKRSAKSEDRAASVRAAQLIKRFGGSVTEAAKSVGRSSKTLKAWAEGKSTPRADSNEALNRANREALVPEGRRERFLKSASDDNMELNSDGENWSIQRPSGVGKPSGGVVLHATIRVSDDVRERKVNLGEWLSEGHMEDLLQAFMDGDEEAMRGVFIEGLDVYFHEAELQDVLGVQFNPLDYGDQ